MGCCPQSNLYLTLEDLSHCSYTSDFNPVSWMVSFEHRYLWASEQAGKQKGHGSGNDHEPHKSHSWWNQLYFGKWGIRSCGQYVAFNLSFCKSLNVWDIRSMSGGLFLGSRDEDAGEVREGGALSWVSSSSWNSRPRCYISTFWNTNPGCVGAETMYLDSCVYQWGKEYCEEDQYISELLSSRGV